MVSAETVEQRGRLRPRAVRRHPGPGSKAGRPFCFPPERAPDKVVGKTSATGWRMRGRKDRDLASFSRKFSLTPPLCPQCQKWPPSSLHTLVSQAKNSLQKNPYQRTRLLTLERGGGRERVISHTYAHQGPNRQPRCVP